MKNLLSKLGAFFGVAYKHIFSNVVVVLFMVVGFGFAVAVFDYGNKYLFLMTFGMGLIYPLCVKGVKKLLQFRN